MKPDFYLSCDHQAPPERWTRAFPAGRVLRSEDVGVCFAEGGVLWLSVDCSQWPERVQEYAVRDGVAVVVTSHAPDARQAVTALRAGARGYCHALAVPEQLIEVHQVVDGGGLWLGRQLLESVLSVATKGFMAGVGAQGGKGGAPSTDVLSAREYEVAAALEQGLSNREIAERLGISERTVKAHLSAVFEKLDVRDRLQLMLLMSRMSKVDGKG